MHVLPIENRLTDNKSVVYVGTKALLQCENAEKIVLTGQFFRFDFLNEPGNLKLETHPTNAFQENLYPKLLHPEKLINLSWIEP